MSGIASEAGYPTRHGRIPRNRDDVPSERAAKPRASGNRAGGPARSSRSRPVAATSGRRGVSGWLVALGLLLMLLRGLANFVWRVVSWVAPRLWRGALFVVRGLFHLVGVAFAWAMGRSGRPVARPARQSSHRPRPATADGRLPRTAPKPRAARSTAGSLRFGLSAGAVLLIAVVTVLASQPAETAVIPDSRAVPSVVSSRSPVATPTPLPAGRVAVSSVVSAGTAGAASTAAAPALAAPAAVPTSSCPDTPANSAKLGAAVDEVLRPHAGHYGVAVLNLGANEAYLLNADERFPAGSVYKLAILYEAWRRVELGILSPDAKITITPADTLEPEPRGGIALGAEVTVREALRAMIAVSSNNAAHAMLRVLGRDAVNRSTRELGLRDTLLPTPIRPTGVVDGDDGSDLAVSSPRDALCYMNLLARDRLLAPAQNVEMRKVLFQQQMEDRLPALLPPNARVAHKTGEIAGVRNDVGIVYTQEATWVVAVFSRDADEGEATAVIAKLSKRLYEYFVGPVIFPTPTPRPSPTPSPSPTSSPSPTPTASPAPTEPVRFHDALE